MTIVDGKRSIHYCIDPGVDGILSLFENREAFET
jgi:hypothetical protein